MKLEKLTAIVQEAAEQARLGEHAPALLEQFQALYQKADGAEEYQKLLDWLTDRLEYLEHPVAWPCRREAIQAVMVIEAGMKLYARTHVERREQLRITEESARHILKEHGADPYNLSYSLPFRSWDKHDFEQAKTLLAEFGIELAMPEDSPQPEVEPTI